MQKIFENLFDRYSRNARLYPSFLALAPVFALTAGYTNWLQFDLQNAVWAIIVGAALFLLADIARQRGKMIERKLLKKWGAFPSVTFLRHRDDAFDPYTTASFHKAAQSLMPDFVMPSEADENNNPEDADNRYRAVTTALLSKTRNTEHFGLLFKENINYGFRRNMLGLKPMALLILSVGIIFCTWRAWGELSAYELPNQRELFFIASSMLAIMVWVFGVTENAVRAVAEDYGRQLLMALNSKDLN